MKAFLYYENLKSLLKRKFLNKITLVTLYMLLALAFLNYGRAQTFNTTIVASDACNSWGAGVTTKTKTITTVGLPAGGLSAGGTVLKQVNVTLGNSSCKKDLRLYDISLTNPTGSVTIQIQGAASPVSGTSGITTTSTSVWMAGNFRDHAELELIRTYTSGVQGGYYPFSIGYYRVETANSFANFNNGNNPNGNWILTIDGATAGSQASIEKVELVFGAAATVTNITGSSSNDFCSSSQCISTSNGVIVGHNRTGGAAPQNYTNGETSTAPGFFPGTTVGSCSWNGADNNSAWFYFTASSANAYISISGMTGTTSTALQPIVLNKGGTCAGAASVPAGGCANDELVNNTAYVSANGGGTATATNVYFNGITANCEFNLSGLTVGQSYFLYIDGNAGANSPFYIEMPNGASSGCTTLPISLTSFYGANACDKNFIYWTTGSERDNDYFILEGSKDGQNFSEIAIIDGSGNTSSETFYQFEDYYFEINSNYYYRISQVDFNGQKETFNTIAIKNDCVNQSVFYSHNKILVTGYRNIENITIFDMLGRKVLETIETSIDFDSFSSAFYNVVVTSKNGNQTSNKIYKP